MTLRRICARKVSCTITKSQEFWSTEECRKQRGQSQVCHMDTNNLLRTSRPALSSVFICRTALRQKSHRYKARGRKSQVEPSESEVSSSRGPCTTVSAADHHRAGYADDAAVERKPKRSIPASTSAMLAFVSLFVAGAAHAAGHAEPSNALSVPTW